jgi:hypothetical protein
MNASKPTLSYSSSFSMTNAPKKFLTTSLTGLLTGTPKRDFAVKAKIMKSHTKGSIIHVENNTRCGAMGHILEMSHESISEMMVLGTLICERIG